MGQHTLTLEVKDALNTSRDTMVLNVENSAPTSGPTGSGTYEVNTPVTLGGQVADFDGDSLTYRWLEGLNVLYQGTVQGTAGGTPVTLTPFTISTLALGSHTITLEVSDGVNNPVSAGVTVEVIDDIPPTLAPAPNPAILWPPNKQMVLVTIKTNAQDNNGQPPALTARVSCNEPNDGSVFWTEPVIDQTTGVITLKLQANRLGKATGRIYSIDITATDEAGNASSAKAVVTVPHDQGKR